MQQPGEEVAGLVAFADAEERADADAGITGPGVAVVPVADPAGSSGSDVVGAATGAPEGEYVSRRKVSRLRTTVSRCGISSSMSLHHVLP